MFICVYREKKKREGQKDENVEYIDTDDFKYVYICFFIIAFIIKLIIKRYVHFM